jgi:hypothetical protein
VTTPSAPPVPDELDRVLRRMRLPYLRKAAPDVLATARAQRWDPAEVLRVLLAEEVTGATPPPAGCVARPPASPPARRW